MGIRDLWKAIHRAEECISLNTLARNMKVEAEQSGQHRTIPCYGVNLNTCIATCIQISSTQGANTHWQCHGGTLYIFLRILLAYATVRATVVFILHGPNRPTMNDGDNLVLPQHRPWWVGAVRELVSACGFTIHYAPGDATAELVMLNQAGIIDAVISNDYDALVYGARRVIVINLSQFIRTSTQDEFEVYHYTSARVHQSAGLTAGGLVLFSLLSGGFSDGHEAARQYCNFETASALSRCSYGDELVDAARTFLFNHHPDDHPDHDGFEIFVSQWRSRLCNELITNHRHRLRACHPDIAHDIRTSGFPKLDALMDLLRPVTSATLPEWYFPSTSGWYLFHEPSLLRIKVFCQDELEWTNPNTLKDRFVKRVLPAIVIHMFYSPLVVYSSVEAKLATPLHQVTIRNLRWTKRKGYSRVPQPRISLSISNLLDVAGLPKSGDEHIFIWASRDMIPYELQESA